MGSSCAAMTPPTSVAAENSAAIVITAIQNLAFISVS